MFYISFEIETPIPYNDYDYEFDDKVLSLGELARKEFDFKRDGRWFFKVYEDISCGIEFVTLPMELGKDLSSANVEKIADDLEYVIGKLVDTYEIKKKQLIKNDLLGSISTHVTITTSKNRMKKVPSKYVANSIFNIINFYAGILHRLSKLTIYPFTRSTYFRRYYVGRGSYVSEKSNYPAVFIPSYDYRDLPPYHKIEYRMPDTMLFSSRKQLYEIVNLLIKLTANKYEPDDSDFLMAINVGVDRLFGSKGLYNFKEIRRSDRLAIEHAEQLLMEAIE